jgi:hypothetical protein
MLFGRQPRTTVASRLFSGHEFFEGTTDSDQQRSKGASRCDHYLAAFRSFEDSVHDHIEAGFCTASGCLCERFGQCEEERPVIGTRRVREPEEGVYRERHAVRTKKQAQRIRRRRLAGARGSVEQHEARRPKPSISNAGLQNNRPC